MCNCCLDAASQACEEYVTIKHACTKLDLIDGVFVHICAADVLLPLSSLGTLSFLHSQFQSLLFILRQMSHFV